LKVEFTSIYVDKAAIAWNFLSAFLMAMVLELISPKCSAWLGKPPGLVVNAEDSQSKPWSLDVGSNPGFA